LAGTDPEGDPLTYTVVTPPSNGTLSGTAPDLTYTPDPDYFGDDSFTFTVNDGESTSEPATVSITVTEVNDPPVANPQNVTTEENTAVDITLTGTDLEGDPLTYTVVTPPSNGILSGTAPDLTYTPDTGYLGSDNFTFKVNDGAIDSTTAEVDITVNPLSTPTIRVYIADIFIVQIRGGWRTCAKAIISAVDNKEPMENIRITAHWEGATTDDELGYTAADGTITFISSYRRYPASGTEYIIVIDTVTLPTGYVLADDSVLTGVVAVD